MISQSDIAYTNPRQEIFAVLFKRHSSWDSDYSKSEDERTGKIEIRKAEVKIDDDDDDDVVEEEDDNDEDDSDTDNEA